MKRRVVSITLVGVALLLALVPVSIYVISEWRMHVGEIPTPFLAEAPVGSESLVRGRHIARTRGCFGCHGQNLEGRVYTEWPWVKRAVAPPLASYAQNHTVAEIEAVIRHGVDPNGRAMFSMPSYNWVHLSDEDLLALVAYLRSEPPINPNLPAPSLGLDARLDIALGDASHMAEWATRIPPLKLREEDDEQLRHGEYLAMTMCIECHGFDLRGESMPDAATPDLAILAAYSDTEFRTLMKSGTTRDGRDEVRLMSMIARDRYAYLSDSELEDLLAYLRTLPE